MRSIFRYPGGKTAPAIQRWILSYRPMGVKEYREPFVGGGGIFFELRTDLTRWINDINPGLIEVYRALRDRPEEFIERCREIAPASDGEELTDPGPRGNGRYPRRMVEAFDRLKLNGDCDQALRYLFVNRTCWGGRVNYDIESRLYFSNPSGWNIVKGDQLERAAEHIKNARITCGDYTELFDAPGEDVWIYADPPYQANTELSRTSQLYQHGFTKEDHERFAEIVKRCKHKVCISYDDDKEGFIRSLFKDFRIEEGEWRYNGSSKSKKDVGKELLIFNYEHEGGVVPAPAVEPELVEVSELSDGEQEYLEECEETIQHAMQSFYEIGCALREIRDGRLYRSWGTFDEYCDNRWGFKRDYAYKQIRAAESIDRLMYTGVYTLPQTEKHVRPLTKLPAPDQQEVWSQVVSQSEESGEPITAKVVESQVRQFKGEPEPTPSPTPFIEKFQKLWAKGDKAEHEEAIEWLFEQGELAE